MSEWHELAHFMYNMWYADPIREIRGLTEEQLFWVPDEYNMCILWHVGHIAHRERFHIGRFLQDLEGEIIPPQFEVFGPDWASVEDVRRSIDSVQSVLDWVKEVRKESHEFIDSLADDDFHRRETVSEDALTVGHWLFITTVHTGVHIGRIQLLRAMLEGKQDRAC